MGTEPAAVAKGELIPAGAAKTFGDLIQKSDLVKRCAQALPKHITPERWWRAVLTAINKTPKLKDCTIESVMDCMLEVAQTGLQIGGALGEAFLIPFRDTRNNRSLCTVVYGWKGLVKLVHNGGAAKSITCDVVHAKDFFEYERGTKPHIKHVPSSEDDPGPIIASYAVAFLGDGLEDFEIMWPRDIKKIRGVSRATSGPWFDWEEQMWKKSAIRRLQNRLPKATDAQQAIAHEDDRLVSAGIYRSPMQAIGAPVGQLPEGDDDAAPEIEVAEDKQIGQLEDLFASKEMSGAARTAFIAKIAKARGIAVVLEDGRMPPAERLPVALVLAMIEELSK